MRIKRMIFGNAAVNGGEGWRTIRKTAQLNMKEESLIKSICSEALADIKTAGSPRSIFYAKRFRKLLLLGYGAEQGTDAHGRPGGWLFYCCACKPYHHGLADAIPLSRFLFDDCRSWLKQDELDLKEKDEQRVEAIIQNAGSISADFWQDLHPLATSMERELRFKHKRAKSYLFPAVRSAHFDVSRSVNSPPFNLIEQRTLWPHVLYVTFGILLIMFGTLVYLTKEELGSTRADLHQREEKIKRLAESVNILHSKNENLENEVMIQADQIEESQREIKSLTDRVTDYENMPNVSQALVKQRDQAEAKAEAVLSDVASLKALLADLSAAIESLQSQTTLTFDILGKVREASGTVLRHREADPNYD